MILYQQYQPAARLSGFIECYWTYHSTVGRYAEEKLIPGGRVEMIFHFDSPFHWLIRPGVPQGDLVSSVHFMGQRDRIFWSRPTGYVHMMGVRFKPGGLAAFTSIPVSELLNCMIPAEDILGAPIKEWEDRLYGLTHDTEKVQLLDRLLSGLLSNLSGPGIPPVPGFAVDFIRKHPEESSILHICGQTGWYYKKLERAFKRTIGYTPKQYCRIVRFNQAIRQIYKQPSLTKISYACGYYDQSHFIKDFYRYAGMAPGNFCTGDLSMTDFLIRHQPV